MNREEYNRKMTDLQVIRGISKSLWRRSFEVQEYPDDVIDICLRRGSVRPAQDYLRAAYLGDLNAAPARPVRPAAPSMRRFGVEIECFGAQRADIIARAAEQGLDVVSESYNHRDGGYAKIVSDASIEGGLGNEVVMPPASELGDLQRICRALRAAGASVNKSCGLHVHIDAAGMTPAHAYRIGLNYYRLRALINKGLAPSRRANRYCWIVMPSMLMRDCGSWDSLLRNCHSRYVAVNYTAYSCHGTIEFRQHQGTINFAKVRRWLLFLQSRVEWSDTHTLDVDVTRRDDPRLAGLRVDYLRELAA